MKSATTLEQSRAEQSRAEQSRAEQSRAEQSYCLKFLDTDSELLSSINPHSRKKEHPP